MPDLVNDGNVVASSEYVRRNDELVPDAGAVSSITGFGTDANDDLFITTISGDIFKVELE